MCYFPLNQLEAGAYNLLENCAEMCSGERLLIVGEKGDNLYFDPQLCKDLAEVASKLGIVSEILLAEPVSDASQFPENVKNAMKKADRTIFFSRLGDQVRFSLKKQKAKPIMAYTLNRRYLAAPFATVDFKVMEKVHDALVELILNSAEYKILGSCGTKLDSKINKRKEKTIVDFAIKLFPIMIFPPVNCDQMQGVLVIKRFVTSSSTRAYENSVLVLDEPIFATIDNSRIVEFKGPKFLIEKLKGQLERAALITGGDPYKVNSWHTGINPNTFYDEDPYKNLERWGTVAYGSPRYTHMHASGIDPGDIAFHLIDATISFDENLIWDKGRFAFLDRPEIRALMSKEQQKLINPDTAINIGL